VKILHIIPSLHGGGAEKFTIDICNELSKGNEVVVCSMYKVTKDMFMAKALNENIKLVTLDKRLGFSPSMFIKVYKTIKEEKPDVVNTHLNAFFYSSLAVIFSKIRFFHTVHNLAKSETRNTYRKIYKVFFKFFSATPVAISQKVLKSIQDEYGKSFNLLIENGVKKPILSSHYDQAKILVDSYKENEETKVFLTIGRISIQKNHKMLIEVFNKLITKGENIVLLIIGDISDESTRVLKEELLSLAKERVHFLGLQEHVSDFLACSDAFCLSSLYEGLPITLLESLSMGVVPICTPAGGIVDVVNEEIGFLSNDFSADLYSANIEAFLKLSHSEREDLEFNAKLLFEEKYDISKTSIQYQNAYKEIY